MRRYLLFGLLLADLAATCVWAQEAAKDPKHDFFGQASLGTYEARDGAFGLGFVLGNRYGWSFHPLLHAGIDFDWYHATEGVTTLQGTQRVIHDAQFDYFPLLGYVQLESRAGSRYIPYVGAGVGYQLAFVEGADFETEIFDGWGWGGWAGLALQLRYKSTPTPTALSVEVFYHSAEVSHMADQPLTGVRTREFVDAGGFGARFGFRFRLPQGK